MRKRTKVSISLLILGVIISIIAFTGIFGEGGPYFILGFGLPLLILGIILLFSLVGTLIIFAGLLVLNIGTALMPQQASASLQTTIAWISFGLIALGIIYGIIEGIMKLVKRNKPGKK